MDFKDIDKVIESQVKFVKDNSNSVNNRIQILNYYPYFLPYPH